MIASRRSGPVYEERPWLAISPARQAGKPADLRRLHRSCIEPGSDPHHAFGRASTSKRQLRALVALRGFPMISALYARTPPSFLIKIGLAASLAWLADLLIFDHRFGATLGVFALAAVLAAGLAHPALR